MTKNKFMIAAAAAALLVSYPAMAGSGRTAGAGSTNGVVAKDPTYMASERTIVSQKIRTSDARSLNNYSPAAGESDAYVSDRTVINKNYVRPNPNPVELSRTRHSTGRTIGAGASN